MAEDFNSIISAEIVATCGAIGYNNKGKYVKDPDCSECLRDLIRFLRNDDESHNIRRQLAKIGVLKTDLIPLLKYYPADKVLFDINIRLLINLTNPVILLYREELPEEKLTRNYYMEILSYQQEYKQAFTDSDIWKELSKRLRDLLQLDWEHCQEEDRLMIERILILIRNILHIPSDSLSEKRTDDDVSIHDQIIWSFHVSGMDDLIIYLAVTDEHKQFCFHVLEIIFLLLREQTPQQLASTGKERFTVEKQKDNQELLMLRKQEALQKKSRLKLQTSRHSRFGGTFEIKNMKSISDQNILYHNKLPNISNLKFNQKEKKRKPKRSQPMQYLELSRKSTLTVRLCLRDFCTEFLNTAYNLFMKLIKEYLAGNNVQANDETYYFWAMKFFMEFNRLSNFEISLITETMSIQSFHYLQTQIEYYYEMMVNNKKMITQWSKRMHLGLKAYQELLLTLSVMDNSSDNEIIKSAKIIKGNLFYMMEYRELLISLLMNYEEVKFSQNYLKDLIETTHIFMKMLEKFCKKQSHLVIQQRKVKKTKKVKSKKMSTNNKNEDYEKLWFDLSENLSTALQQNIDDDDSVTIFDPTSDCTIDQQRIDAIVKIKDALQKKNVNEAILLLRAARNIWPENDVFGIPTITPENEFIVLREIYFSDLLNKNNTSDQRESNEFNEESNTEDEELEARTVQLYEKEFDFKGFVSRFANWKIVRAYTELLKNYQKNTDYTNTCIIRMLHRISWDCKMAGFLYQATIFQTLQKILNSPEYSPVIKELKRFSKFIVRKFFEVAQKNNKVFVEILFWKRPCDIYEIENGYGTNKSRNVPELWNEEQEDELQSLYHEYKDNTEDDKDVVDHILEHMIDQTKTRRQIIRKLKQLGILQNAKELHKSKAVHLKRDWTEEEIASLLQLYEKYKDSIDIVGLISQNLSNKIPKSRIVEKLLELGVVQNKNQLRKKKIKTSKISLDSKIDVSTAEESESENLDSDLNEIDTDSVNEAIHAVISLGFEFALTWLKESLQDEIDDRKESDDYESVPIVPLHEKHHAAIGNKQFLHLMKILGFIPPASEQESFWRIPSSMTTKQMQTSLELLNKALHNQSNKSENDLVLNEDISSHINEINEFPDDAKLENVESQLDDLKDAEVNIVNEAKNIQNDGIRIIESDEEDTLPRKRFKRRIIESDEDE